MYWQYEKIGVECIQKTNERGDNMSEKERNIAESLTRACELLPDGKKEYLIGYAEGVAAMAEKAKEHTNGEKEARPWRGGARKEVSGVKIIIEADSKEIADLVLTLQSQRNQDEITKNYTIDIFGNKYLDYESGGRGCSNG